MSDWNLEKCNSVLHTMSLNMHDRMPHVAFEDVQHIVKEGVLWMHLYTHVSYLLKADPIEECIQNMNALHDHIHTNPQFIREYTSFLSEEQSESVIVQYAISLKKYKHFMLLQKENLQSVLHSLIMVTPEEVPLLIPSAREKIKEYLRIKKDVCDSVFRLFEYVVEHEQLQTMLMHPALQPSSDPLLGEEVPFRFPLQEQEMHTLAQDPHPTLPL
jgi:hypothetical protein